MGDLTGRTVVVTGASSGIGLAAATELGRRGANVVLVGRDPARLAAAVDVVRAAAGGRTPPAYRADFAPGADTLVWLASTPRPQLTNGGYYVKRTLRTPARHAADPVLAARLWDASLAAVGLG